MALNLIEVQKNHLIIMVAKLKVFTAFSKKADWMSSEPHAARTNGGRAYRRANTQPSNQRGRRVK